MKGAREYADLFETGQYGRLWIISGSHARGRTFHIYILPEGEHWPNRDAVEVYGIVSGQPGWTEYYGWLHRGKWCDDFAVLCEAKKKEQERKAVASKKERQDAAENANKRITELLGAY